MRKLIVIVCASFWMLSCGSLKRTQKADTVVHTQSQTATDSSSVISRQTEVFGDTLSGNSFVPVVFTNPGSSAPEPDTAAYHINAESDGLRIDIGLTPVYKNNQLTGMQATYKSVAKPTSKTSSTEHKQANVRETTKKDSSSALQSTVKTNMGWSFPWWGWILAGAFVLYVLWRLIKKYLP